jgi:hypothetical protein
VVVFDLGDSSKWVTEYYPIDAMESVGDKTRVTMRVSDPLVAARLLVRLGTDATFVSGEEVAAAMGDLTSRIRARYASVA